MTCSDCGEFTLAPGVCIDCTNKRIDQWPRLRAVVDRLNIRIDELEKFLNDLDTVKQEVDNISPIAGIHEKAVLKELIKIRTPEVEF